MTALTLAKRKTVKYAYKFAILLITVLFVVYIQQHSSTDKQQGKLDLKKTEARRLRPVLNNQKQNKNQNQKDNTEENEIEAEEIEEIKDIEKEQNEELKNEEKENIEEMKEQIQRKAHPMIRDSEDYETNES